MATCTHCGQGNRDGAVFCQGCGQRLGESESPKVAAPVSVAVPAGGASAPGPTCASCGALNAPGMNFCKMCGSSLVVSAAPAAQAASPDLASSHRVACPACHKLTPSGFSFCQHCGQRLGGPAVGKPAAVVGGKAAVAATMMAEPPVPATPPAGMPRPSDAVAPLGAASEMPRSTGAQNTMKADALSAEPVFEEAVHGTLVVVRRDGSDGDSVRIKASTFDIGRTEGGLHFGDDIYLAERHARILFSGGKATLRPLDTVNGVYLRLRGPIELHPGDQFLVGKEVIRWEPVGAEGGDVAVIEHGVRVFGTVPREAWGRLRQITSSGTTRDVWHLSRPDLVLGREEGDLTFPDDEFMSRRHAAVRRGATHPKLEDLNSSNGTFIRIRADHELKSGDLLRLGDQLLRVEL